MELFRMHKGRKNFLPFAQKSEVLLFHGADRLGLVDRKPLQEPAVFLPGKVPYLGGIPWPLETAVIQSFIQKAEAIFFKMQRLDPVTASPTKKEQGIAVGIHFIGIPDDGHQSINTFSHVGVAALSYC
jgi:hypothetical protein